MKQVNETVLQAPVSKLLESPSNPRKHFGGLKELADSITAQGILQPIVVRELPGGAFEVVFGHRRLRAAKLAGLSKVPVIVRELSDVEVLEQQHVENVQREDVHPLEEAESLKKLLGLPGYSVARLMERTGKSKSSVHNSLTLLKLHAPARAAFVRGALTSSTAMLVAMVDGERQQELFLEAIVPAKGEPLSFRQAQKIQQSRFSGGQGKSKKKPVYVQTAQKLKRTAELVRRRAVELVERKPAFDTQDLRILALALSELGHARGVLQRRGWESAEAAAAGIAKKGPAELRGLVLELAVYSWADAPGGEYSPGLRALAGAYRLDVKDIEETAAELERAELE